ncbi:phiSA1p31-related protein [Nonomuraea wenchangensis]
MTSQYRHGEIVDITIRARVEEVCHHGFADGHELKFTYTAPSGTPFGNGVVYDAPSVTIVRVTPADGEPQPGDLWKDRDGQTWFCARHLPDFENKADLEGANEDGWRPVLVPINVGPYGSSPMRPEQVNREHGPLVLAHRPAQPAAGLDWTWDNEDNPRTCTDPSGKVWDLTAKYRDGDGLLWHWAGGFSRAGGDGPMRPLMSRDDWSQADVQITDIPGPLTPVGELPQSSTDDGGAA